MASPHAQLTNNSFEHEVDVHAINASRCTPWIGYDLNSPVDPSRAPGLVLVFEDFPTIFKYRAASRCPGAHVSTNA